MMKPVLWRAEPELETESETENQEGEGKSKSVAESTGPLLGGRETLKTSIRKEIKCFKLTEIAWKLREDTMLGQVAEGVKSFWSWKEPHKLFLDNLGEFDSP